MALVSVETPREFVNRAYEVERLVFRYLLSLGLDRETPPSPQARAISLDVAETKCCTRQTHH
jgi:hypothetical protein